MSTRRARNPGPNLRSKYMHRYAYIYIYIYIYADVCAYKQICVDICIYADMCAYMRVYLILCVQIAYMHTYMCIRAHICIYADMHMICKSCKRHSNLHNEEHLLVSFQFLVISSKTRLKFVIYYFPGLSIVPVLENKKVTF